MVVHRQQTAGNQVASGIIYVGIKRKAKRKPFDKSMAKSSDSVTAMLIVSNHHQKIQKDRLLS